jgi:hypothetical protein
MEAMLFLARIGAEVGMEAGEVEKKRTRSK